MSEAYDAAVEIRDAIGRLREELAETAPPIVPRRERIATAVLASLVAGLGRGPEEFHAGYAWRAVQLADALMAELDRPKE
jgi:hypothetical protein